MATIYRFVVENGKGSGNGQKGVGGNKNKKVKGKGTGVELNRYRRISTTIGNKLTGQMYSRGIRGIRAVTHLVSKNEITGKMQVNGVAIAILIQLVLQLIGKIDQHFIIQATRENTMNYRKLEVGKNQISNNFDVSTNFFTGKVTYKENK